MSYNLYIRPGRWVKLRWFNAIENSKEPARDWVLSDPDSWIFGGYEERQGVVEKLFAKEGELFVFLQGDNTPYPLAHVTHVKATAE